MHLLHLVLSFHEVIAKNDKHLEFSQKQSKYGSNIQKDKKRTSRKKVLEKVSVDMKALAKLEI